MYRCSICSKGLDSNETYENRGSYSCAGCLDNLAVANNREEATIYKEQELPPGTISVELYKTLVKNHNILI